MSVIKGQAGQEKTNFSLSFPVIKHDSTLKHSYHASKQQKTQLNTKCHFSDFDCFTDRKCRSCLERHTTCCPLKGIKR